MSCCRPRSCGCCHSFHGSLLETIAPSVQSGCTSVQTFLGSPDDYSVVKLSQTDINHCNSCDINCFIHSKLLTNLAKDACTTLSVVRQELQVANKLQRGSVVMHIGKTVKKGSINNTIERVNQLRNEGLLPYGSLPKLHLEIAAGAGTEVGSSKEEIRHLWEHLDYNVVGVCLDTQHAFAAGLCNFSSIQDVDNVMDIFRNNTGRYPGVIHLNDSRVPFGSKVDRHAPIGEGSIWPSNNSESYFTQQNLGLVRLKQYSLRYNIDVVSETSDPISDMKLWNDILIKTM